MPRGSSSHRASACLAHLLHQSPPEQLQHSQAQLPERQGWAVEGHQLRIQPGGGVLLQVGGESTG